MPDRLPWYIAGPGLGLLVVGLFAIANRPIGSVGAYIQTLTLVRTGRAPEPWRVRFFVGLFVGGLLAALLRGDFAVGLGYGELRDELALPELLLVLLAGGALMGFGARWSGGCTTGHGLCGSSVRSPGSMVATGTFMVTAVAVTFLIHVVFGGAL